MKKKKNMLLTLLLVILLLLPSPTLAANGADINADGIVNSQDLTALLMAYGSKDSASDINGDGIVNSQDLTILLMCYGDTAHSKYYVPGVPAEEMFTYFSEVVLDSEYGGSFADNLVRKWVEPIYYDLYGEYTAEDAAIIQGLTAQLNAIEGFPKMIPADSSHASVWTFNFLNDDDFSDQMAELDIYDYLDGLIYFWFNGDCEVGKAVTYYRGGMQGDIRISVIKEEIVNGLGPIDDTEVREDSVIYQYGSAVTELSDIDLAILKLLYSPEIKPGMDYAECEEVIMRIYY